MENRHGGFPVTTPQDAYSPRRRKYMSKKILITGAGGFIGGFIVAEALKRGYETYAGVRHSTNMQFLQDERIHPVYLTYRDKHKLKDEIEAFTREYGKWDYIIHNLGLTKTSDKKRFDEINFEYMKNFVDTIISTGNTPEKFIYMSSLSAWTTGDKGYDPINDKDTPCPETAYGRSKLRSELYLRSLAGFPYVAMRPTGVYGPHEKDYLMMIKMINKGIDIAVGKKRKVYTFIYVKDLVKAIYLAIERGIAGHGYFIADGNTYSQRDFRKIVAARLGKKHVLSVTVPEALCRFVCAKAEDIAKKHHEASTLNRDKYYILKQHNWACDTSRAEEELGFFADYNLEQGIDEAVTWYEENGWI